jgi:hypothetical protein
MCELLICAQDQTSDTSVYANANLPKFGDVITAQQDGWTWGALELTDPRWRIIKLPGIDVSAVAALLMPEQPPTSMLKADGSVITPNTLQYRGYYVTAANVGAALPTLAAYLADDTRAQSSFSIADPLVFSQVVAQWPPIAMPTT